jgi:hypothetical protein
MQFLKHEKGARGRLSCSTWCGRGSKCLSKSHQGATILVAQPPIALNQQCFHAGYGFHQRLANQIPWLTPCSRKNFGLHLHTPFRQVKVDYGVRLQGSVCIPLYKKEARHWTGLTATSYGLSVA